MARINCLIDKALTIFEQFSKTADYLSSAPRAMQIKRNYAHAQYLTARGSEEYITLMEYALRQQRDDIVLALLPCHVQKDVPADQAVDKEGTTALYRATLAHALPTVNALIEAGHSPFQINTHVTKRGIVLISSDLNALYAAINVTNIDVAELVMKAALTTPMLMPDYLRTLCLTDLITNAAEARSLAVAGRWLTLLKQFVALDVTMVNCSHNPQAQYIHELPSAAGLTPLQYVINPHVRIGLVKTLLESAKTHQPVELPETRLAQKCALPEQAPMMLAAIAGRADLIALLHAHGAPATEQTIIAAAGRADLIALLHSYGAPVTEQAMIAAVKGCHLQAVRQLKILNPMLSLNTIQCEDGGNLLHAAYATVGDASISPKDRLDMVSYLVRSGVDMTHQNTHLQSPLHLIDEKRPILSIDRNPLLLPALLMRDKHGDVPLIALLKQHNTGERNTISQDTVHIHLQYLNQLAVQCPEHSDEVASILLHLKLQGVRQFSLDIAYQSNFNETYKQFIHRKQKPSCKTVGHKPSASKKRRIANDDKGATAMDLDPSDLSTVPMVGFCFARSSDASIPTGPSSASDVSMKVPPPKASNSQVS